MQRGLDHYAGMSYYILDGIPYPNSYAGSTDMIVQKRKLSVFVCCVLALVLALSLVACNTRWTAVAVDILKAAQPTIQNIAPSIAPGVETIVQGLQNWSGDTAVLTNIVGEIQVSLDNLDALFPKMSDHDKQLALWIGSGLESVLVVIQAHIPATGQAAMARVSHPHNMGTLKTYPDAASYKAAKP